MPLWRGVEINALLATKSTTRTNTVLEARKWIDNQNPKLAYFQRE